MIFDLTMTIEDDMHVFKGDPKVTLKQVATMHKDGYSNFVLSTNMHAGTHIDGAAHMLADKPLIDQCRLDDLIGLGRYVSDDVPYENKGESRLVVKMGGYTLNEAFIEAVILAKIKLIVIDKASIDDAPYTSHKRLFNHGILIVENAVDIERLSGSDFFELYVIPLKIKADSAPVRLFAKTI